MNKDYCFIVKLTDNCNMRCRYCYHFQHNTNHVYNNMQIEVVDKVIERLIEHNHQYAHFIWHGGEPLLMGLAFFEHIINKQKEVLRTNDKDIVISNGIQTNGTLLTRDTIDFLVENHFYIGLSLDGDEAMQSSDRGMPHNAFEDMMKSIVAPNGDIFPCDCFECSVENKLGNIMKSIGQLDNEDFIRNLSVQAHIRPQQCEMCLFKEMCQGGCAYYRWLSDEKLEKPSFYCIAFKMLYSHINSFMEA